MRVKINLKQIGEKRQRIAPIDFDYPCVPKTVRELIVSTVQICVEDYNKRVRAGGDVQKPLTEQQVSDMATVGKIAFGINYGGKEQDLDKAVENALQSYEDGLYRVFLNEDELEGLDTPININEPDSLTFIKLTMLAGRMW